MPIPAEEKRRQETPAEKKPYPPPKGNAALRERQYGDRPQEEAEAEYEPTYRDGSLKNECW